MAVTGRVRILGAIVLILTLSAGCGGGGGGAAATGATPGSSAPKTLHWSSPTAYNDGSALNPATDIDSFEIYVKDTPTFTNGDAPMASVGGLDNSYNLNSLNLSAGVTYYVSIRTIAKNGEKSGFSASASFSL